MVSKVDVSRWLFAMGWRGEFSSDIKLTELADTLPPMRKDIDEVTKYVNYNLRREWLLYKRADNARKRKASRTFEEYFK